MQAFNEAMDSFYKKFPQEPLGGHLRGITGQQGSEVMTRYLQTWVQKDTPPTQEEHLVLAGELSKVWGQPDNTV